MKNIFLGMLAIALTFAPVAYGADGGKKKLKKKAKTECTKDKCCNPKVCPKDIPCPPIPICTGNK
jgi:hypothetical protein